MKWKCFWPTTQLNPTHQKAKLLDPTQPVGWPFPKILKLGLINFEWRLKNRSIWLPCTSGWIYCLLTPCLVCLFKRFPNISCPCRDRFVQIYVERISGCAHMNCPMCASEFCYNCGADWQYLHLMKCAKALEDDAEHRRVSGGARRRRLRKKLKKGEIIGKTILCLIILSFWISSHCLLQK